MKYGKKHLKIRCFFFFFEVIIIWVILWIKSKNILLFLLPGG